MAKAKKPAPAPAKKAPEQANADSAKTKKPTESEKAPEAIRATVSVNGGEKIDAFSEEGRALVLEAIEKAKEAMAEGEKPTVSLNDGPELPYDSPELEKAFSELLAQHEAGTDGEKDAPAPEPAPEPAPAPEKGKKAKAEKDDDKAPEPEKPSRSDAAELMSQAIDRIMSFASPIRGALTNKPNVQKSWNETVEQCKKAQAAYKDA